MRSGGKRLIDRLIVWGGRRQGMTMPERYKMMDERTKRREVLMTLAKKARRIRGVTNEGK